MKEVKQIGNVLPTEKRDNPNQGRVYDSEELSPCINTMQGGNLQPMIIQETISTKEKKRDIASTILNGYERSNMTGFNADNGVMETVKIIQATKKGYAECEVGGNCKEPKCIVGKQMEDKMIVAMRGRNPKNPSDRTSGIETEQRLEPQQEGICNTLTSVQKDNLVLEPKVVGGLGEKVSNNGTQYYQQDRVYSSKGIAMCHPANIPGGTYKYMIKETVKIKQATKKGYAECEVGGVADLSYVSSTTRRGRVQDNGQVSPTLTVADIEGIKRIEKVGQISSEGSQCGTVVSDNGLMGTLSAGTHGYGNNHILSQYRIRKLTPKECWRLMGFTDEEFEKAAAVNSNTQLYKQAGNSIVVDVLVAIFSEMINSLEDKTPKYQYLEQMSLFDYE